MDKDNKKTPPTGSAKGSINESSQVKQIKPKRTSVKSERKSTSSTSRPDKFRHSFWENEDEFEEFEQTSAIESQRDLNDRITIWMNSWMDEDDGDFVSAYHDNVEDSSRGK